MIGSESIDLSLKNIWKTWFEFKKGKTFTSDLHYFQYFLEANLFALFEDLNSGKYRHGGYRKFIVSDNKKREISVAGIRDRLVHRLIYDYLNKIYDKTFINDLWSCRTGKGLLGAILRTQEFLKNHPNSFIWKCDVRKFFDSVDQEVLLKILALKIRDNSTFKLLIEIIGSYSPVARKKMGMPIGNLTSQIFANIYLNELDRFVKHQLKPKAYLRYGDDFILIETDFVKLENFRIRTTDFLNSKLCLRVNPKCDKIIKARQGLKYLGVKIWPHGRNLNKRNQRRVKHRMNLANLSSYFGLMKQHGSSKQKRIFNWMVNDQLVMEI